MANTYTLIASSTVGSGGSTSVSFTSIPQTYTDLKVLWSAQNNRADGNFGYLSVSFNSSTTSFSTRALYGTGTAGSQASDTTTSNYASYALATQWEGTSIFGNGEMYISNYSGNNNKTYVVDDVSEQNGTSNVLNIIAGLWANTSAINSITFTTSGNATKFNQFSNFYLYGISKS